MKKNKNTDLLAKAKKSVPRAIGRPLGVVPRNVETLALAWVRGEITNAAAAEALTGNRRYQTNTYGTLARAVRQAVLAGRFGKR